MVATTPITIGEQIRSAIRFLRDAGREGEARAVETLLGTSVPSRLAPAVARLPKDDGIPAAVAAERLGMDAVTFARWVNDGLLAVVETEAPGGPWVTEASVEWAIEAIRSLAIISSPMPGDVDPPNPGESLLAQILRDARRPRPGE